MYVIVIAIVAVCLTVVEVMHHIRTIHTDLKPENILFVDDSVRTVMTDKGERFEPVKPDIMVIDFGSAVMEQHYKSSVICTRHYRAPEITLGVLGSRVRVCCRVC